jgi:polyhydroxyalkanoate synthase subunit PhaC
MQDIADINHYSYLPDVFSLYDMLVDNFLRNTFDDKNNNSISNLFYQTPHEVIKQIDGGIRLLRYRQNNSSDPTTENKKLAPLLIIYAPINRYHILDISKDRSIVNKFVSSGFDVFLMDWGRQENNNLTMTDYVNCISHFIEHIKIITDSESVSVHGYSWAGVLSIIYASLFPNNIKNIIIHSSQIDFDKDNTILAQWIRNLPLDQITYEFKELFGHFINLAFLMRNPFAQSIGNLRFALEMEEYGINFLLNLIRLFIWLRNTPDIPGLFFKQFATDFYINNLLIKNKTRLAQTNKGLQDRNNPTYTQLAHSGGKERAKVNEEINIENITMPLLNIVATDDDLVSPESSIPLTDIAPSKDKKLIEFPADHIVLCIGSSAHRDLWPKVVEWLKKRS